MKINILEYLAVLAGAAIFGFTTKRLILVRLRWENGMWQSEDPATGADGYILGPDIPPILVDRLAQDGLLDHALANGVTMILNPFGFPGATHCLERTGHELGITWYRDSHSAKVGGLGPDLLRYWFPPPPKLWVQLDASNPPLCGDAPSVPTRSSPRRSKAPSRTSGRWCPRSFWRRRPSRKPTGRRSSPGCVH